MLRAAKAYKIKTPHPLICSTPMTNEGDSHESPSPILHIVLNVSGLYLV